MPLDLVKKFEKDNTAYFECYFRNMQSVLTDPTNPKWEIYDIRGNLVSGATGTPTKKSDGLFYFFWTPTTAGDFLLIFSGKVEGYDVTMRKRFKVIRTSLKGEFSSSSSSSCSSSFSSCSSSFSSSSSSSSSSSEST